MNKVFRYWFGAIVLLTAIGVPSGMAGGTNGVPLWAKMQKAVLKDDDLGEVQALVKAGFDVNSPIGCGSYNALDGAVSRSNFEMVKWLLANGAKAKGSALLQAVRCSSVETSSNIVAALLKAGANPNYKEDYPNPAFHTDIPITTPLHTACYEQNVPVVALLLAQPGIELNTLDVDNRTPLMWAVAKHDSTIVEMLLNAGADPSVKNKKGETAFSVAQRQIAVQKSIIRLMESKKVSRREDVRPTKEHSEATASAP